MPFSGFLDACVLHPASLRDTLLRLSEAGLYRPLWSDGVLEEMRRSIVSATPGLQPSDLDRTIAAMGRAFADARVESYAHLEPAVTNDPEDRHVLAAAITGRADVQLVTANLRDFPVASSEPYGIEAR